MALPQQKFREVVLQFLFSLDYGHGEDDALIELLMEQQSISRKNAREAFERAKLVYASKQELDKEIIAKVEGYEFERILPVERNVLRLGVFELQKDEAIPAKVAIAEAIRIAKKFGSPSAASFVNGILDGIYKSMGD